MLTSKALAGYLETASGRSLVFAAFVNNVPLDAPKPDRISFGRDGAGRPAAGQALRGSVRRLNRHGEPAKGDHFRGARDFSGAIAS